MPEGDGADELVSGMGRAAITGLGVVAENGLRRRADADRQRAEEARASADADRARTAAVEEVTAVAVLRRDDRTRTAEVDAERAPRLAAPLEPDVAGARDLAARSFAQAAAAATAPAATAKGRPARARARGAGAERDRGR